MFLLCELLRFCVCRNFCCFFVIVFPCFPFLNPPSHNNIQKQPNISTNHRKQQGKVWTRDTQGAPAGPYSWESFEVSVQNRKVEEAEPECVFKQNEKLREENEKLKKEVEELKKFKEVVANLKGLMELC